MIHGILWQNADASHQVTNATAAKEYYPDFGQETAKYPSMFKAVQEAYPNRAMAAFAEWEEILNGVVEPDAGVMTKASDSKYSFIDVADYIKGEQYKNTAIVYMQSDWIDHVGHSTGYYNDIYYSELKQYDDYFKAVIDALKETGTYDETLIIANADHGGSATGHGSTDPSNMDIFIGLGGQTIDSGKRLNGGDNSDIAALALYGLRIDKPETMTTSDVFDTSAFLTQEEMVKKNRDIEKITYNRGGKRAVLTLSNPKAETRVIDAVIALNGENVENIDAKDGKILRQEVADDQLKLTIAYDSQPETLAEITFGNAGNTAVQEIMLGTAEGKEIYPDLKNDNTLDTSAEAVEAAKVAETAKEAAETARAEAEKAQSAAEKAQAGAETAKEEAKAAQAKAEEAQTAAETLAANVDADKKAVEEAKTKAETAKAEAEAARKEAETAETAATNAQAKAETAKAAAEVAQTAAETAKAAAEAAQAATETAKEDAIAAATQAAAENAKAEAAKNEAVTARKDAENYAGIAETAKAAAEAAQAAAETAKAEAEKAQSAAETAAAEAKTSKAEAKAAQAKAEEAQKNAENLAATVGADKEAVETAKAAAVSAEIEAKAAIEKAKTAQAAAEAAQTKAEEARKAAETAQVAAEAAKAAAEAESAAAKADLQQAETARTEAAADLQQAETARTEAAADLQQAEAARAEAEAAQAAAEDEVAEAKAAQAAAETDAQTAREAALEAQKALEIAKKEVEEILALGNSAQQGQTSQKDELEGEEYTGDAEEEEEDDESEDSFEDTTVKIKKLTSKKAKQMELSWKQNEDADGYIIEYANKSNFKGKKTIKIKDGKTEIRKIKKLKSGKKYYVRIRAYMTVDKEYVYSQYSKAMVIRVK